MANGTGDNLTVMIKSHLSRNRMCPWVADPIEDCVGYMPVKKIPENTLENAVSEDWCNKHVQSRGKGIPIPHSCSPTGEDTGETSTITGLR